ncbi:metallophosphoesterase family protein [Bacteroidota bacterium]
MRNLYFLLILLIFVVSCSEDSVDSPIIESTASAKIAIFSDPHLYDAVLGEPVDTTYPISFNFRMIMESEEVLKSLITDIKQEGVDLVIVPGDLTNNGEKVNHIKFAVYLKELEDAGIAVFVVPGNHDIENPGSKNYSGGSPVPEASISPEEFSTIYADFGYSEALETDPNSLSYIAEPVDGLWLIGMDDCRYNENAGDERAIVGGRFNPETINWIKQKISKGKQQGKLVFGILHHGIIEHFTDQKVFPFTGEYVVDDWEQISTEFMNLGLKIMFTGHFHSNDIVKKVSGSKFLFDIETGSLSAYTNPYRIVELSEGSLLSIRTKHITEVNVDTEGKTFPDYSYGRMLYSNIGIAEEVLVQYLQYSAEEAEEMAPVVAGCFIRNNEGDETMFTEAKDLIDVLKLNTGAIAFRIPDLLESMLTDLPPKDNNITIDLKTGKVNY